MEFNIEARPLESTKYASEIKTTEKAGICGKCSVNLKAELEAAFWNMQVKAMDEDMRALRI